VYWAYIVSLTLSIGMGFVYMDILLAADCDEQPNNSKFRVFRAIITPSFKSEINLIALEIK